MLPFTGGGISLLLEEDFFFLFERRALKFLFVGFAHLPHRKIYFYRGFCYNVSWFSQLSAQQWIFSVQFRLRPLEVKTRPKSRMA